MVSALVLPVVVAAGVVVRGGGGGGGGGGEHLNQPTWEADWLVRLLVVAVTKQNKN